MLAALVVVIVILWRYPDAELVLFHAVWITLAILATRISSERMHVWLLIAFVGALAVVVEVDDLRTHYEELETFVELALDVPAFVALVVLARRQGQVLERERADALADQSRHERQRRFFGNAAHAMRTPITIARGHIELAMSSITDPVVRDDLTVALDELDRLTRAADRNIRLSVAGEGHEQHLRSVDAASLVRTTVERWKPTAPRRWSDEVDGEGVELLADPEQLTEALDAMIENAVLATEAGDTIVVRAESRPAAVVLSVSDSGAGVEGPDLERLFEPFQQGPQRRPDQPAGTGLGLAVVQAIAAAHGGSASMVSRPGQGTTVSMSLPRQRPRRRHR